MNKISGKSQKAGIQAKSQQPELKVNDKIFPEEMDGRRIPGRGQRLEFKLKVKNQAMVRI